MAKFIGTGKDPRAPEGVDFDIPDARPNEQALVEESGIGEPVPAGEEAEAVHAGHEVIAQEGGTSEQVAGDTGIGEHADRVAARVESTSANPQGRGEGDSGGGSGGNGGEGLSSLSRAELNDRAKAAGVEDPESLPNKDAVVDAIREREGTSEG